MICKPKYFGVLNLGLMITSMLVKCLWKLENEEGIWPIKKKLVSFIEGKKYLNGKPFLNLK